MTIEFTCQKCEGTFEIDMQELIDGSEALECPHCGNKVSKADYKAAVPGLRVELINAQYDLRNADFPVIIWIACVPLRIMKTR